MYLYCLHTTAMNIMNFNTSKLTPEKSAKFVETPKVFNQDNAPSLMIKLYANQFKGTVIRSTNVTAIPKPTAVPIFFDTARYEHIPKK